MKNKQIQSVLQDLIDEAAPTPAAIVRAHLSQIEAARNVGVTWCDLANALGCSPGALRTAYYRYRRRPSPAARPNPSTPSSRGGGAGIVAVIGDGAARNLDLINHTKKEMDQ